MDGSLEPGLAYQFVGSFQFTCDKIAAFENHALVAERVVSDLVACRDNLAGLGHVVLHGLAIEEKSRIDVFFTQNFEDSCCIPACGPIVKSQCDYLFRGFDPVDDFTKQLE